MGLISDDGELTCRSREFGNFHAPPGLELRGRGPAEPHLGLAQLDFGKHGLAKIVEVRTVGVFGEPGGNWRRRERGDRHKR